jgi:ankyrin repeat protein
MLQNRKGKEMIRIAGATVIGLALLLQGCSHTNSLTRSTVPKLSDEFRDAARLGHANTIISLSHSYPDQVNARDAEGRTPLCWAVHGCNTKTVEILIDRGAQVNVKDNYGDSPLEGAATFGCADIVKLLLSKGAEVNIRNNENRTPLYYAEKHAQKDVADLLRAHGAVE